MSSPPPPPMLLTPDSTGSSGNNNIKKSRRQTAFYPNVNSSNKPQKPFSRSAAKRESVMALGSIEHLQHYFTKTGIAAKKNPLNKLNNGLVPAIGGATHFTDNNQPFSPLPEFNLPPSPAVPPPAPRPSFPPVVKTYETNPDSLLPGVVEDLTAVARTWRIKQDINGTDIDHPHDPSLLGVNASSSSFDVLSVLKTTTRAIRSVRNYVVSLPDDSAGTIRANFRPNSLQPIHRLQKSRSSISTAGTTTPIETDPLTLIRRSALDVLTVLRRLEESSRVPLSDDAYDAQSEHGSNSGASSLGGSGSVGQSVPSRVASPEHDTDIGGGGVSGDQSFAFSLVQVQGRDESVPVWEDDFSTTSMLIDDGPTDHEKREHWDAKLVLGSGWLYRPDIRLETLTAEQDAIARYLDVVDTVLFGGTKDGKRGWMRAVRKGGGGGGGGEKSKGRRVSSGGSGQGEVVSSGMVDMMQGMGLTEEPEDVSDEEEVVEAEGYVDDEDLPTWAKRSSFVDDELGRAHAVITAFLPAHLLVALASRHSATAFLQSLSSGQLLCVAYNACVRRSRRPWGYISKDAIHDIVALQNTVEREGDDNDGAEDKEKRVWTFRRTDNLRLWAAALKIRYLLPILTPPAPTKPTNSHAHLGVPTPLPSPVSSPSSVRFPSAFPTSSSDPPVLFDPPLVARRDEGWEEMLRGVLRMWVDTVVDERRGEQRH